MNLWRLGGCAVVCSSRDTNEALKFIEAICSHLEIISSLMMFVPYAALYLRSACNGQYRLVTRSVNQSNREVKDGDGGGG